SCSGSTCVCNAVGQTLCGSACADLQTDVSHCGGCDVKCPANFVCSSGQCRCPDPTVSTPVRLTTTATATGAPSAAWDGSHLGVVYTESDDASFNPTTNVVFALLNADGTRARTDIPLTAFTANGVKLRPRIAWSGKEYGVLWLQNDGTS